MSIGKRGPLLRRLLPHLLLLFGVVFPFLLPAFSPSSEKVCFSVSFGIAANSCNTDVYFRLFGALIVGRWGCDYCGMLAETYCRGSLRRDMKVPEEA